MNLKTIGLGLLGLGLFLSFVAFTRDTAPEGTYNIGLQQEQMMMLLAGLAMCLGGSVMTAIGEALQRMERAGLLPPAGVRPTLGTSHKGNVE